jgi:hypothetical protein
VQSNGKDDGLQLMWRVVKDRARKRAQRKMWEAVKGIVVDVWLYDSSISTTMP